MLSSIYHATPITKQTTTSKEITTPLARKLHATTLLGLSKLVCRQPVAHSQPVSSSRPEPCAARAALPLGVCSWSDRAPRNAHGPRPCPPDICDICSLHLSGSDSLVRRRPSARPWTGKQSPSRPGLECAPSPSRPSPRRPPGAGKAGSRLPRAGRPPLSLWLGSRRLLEIDEAGIRLRHVHVPCRACAWRVAHGLWRGRGQVFLDTFGTHGRSQSPGRYSGRGEGVRLYSNPLVRNLGQPLIQNINKQLPSHAFITEQISRKHTPKGFIRTANN